MHEERLKRRERMAEVATFPLQAMQEKPIGGDKDFDEQPSFRNLRYQAAKLSHNIGDSEAGVLSYKNFVLAHDDNSITPENSTKAYRIYKRIYSSLREGAERCRRISNVEAILMVKFVMKNELAPWFKDRYDPEQSRKEYMVKSELVADAHKAFMNTYPDIPDLSMNVESEVKNEEIEREEKSKRVFVGPQSTLAEKAARGIKSVGRFFHNCVVIRSVPISITKSQIKDLVQHVKHVYFGAPSFGLIRYCYLIMGSQEECKSLVMNKELGGINGMKVTPQWTIEAIPCRPSTIRRPRSAPQISLNESRLKYDTARMLKLIDILGERYDLSQVNEARELYEQIDEENALLKSNYTLAYLRRVLFLDYYTAKEFPSYEKLVISTGFEARPRGEVY